MITIAAHDRAVGTFSAIIQHITERYLRGIDIVCKRISFLAVFSCYHTVRSHLNSEVICKIGRKIQAYIAIEGNGAYYVITVIIAQTEAHRSRSCAGGRSLLDIVVIYKVERGDIVYGISAIKVCHVGGETARLGD